MKYYIIAGEASGDLHGSGLIRGLRNADPSAEIRCWGGDLMQAEGATLVKHYRELAFMGFAEVILNVRTIFRNIAFCKKDIAAFKPDAIIFIDYPGFNMRIAKWARQNGYATHYYISPQIWAWKENRIKDIRRDVDHMYVILPFELDYYRDKHNYKVDFVGHPLIDAINRRQTPDIESFRKTHGLDQRPIIALLPGSRKQEISKMLREMLAVMPRFRGYQFVIAGAPGQDAAFYTPFLSDSGARLIHNQTYDLLSVAQAALVTSGTATLETALFKVPQVVLYKGSWASYQIAKRIISLKYISLVNLIMDKPVVTELIQGDCQPDKIASELSKLFDPAFREPMMREYALLQTKLGGAGAGQKTADLIYNRTVKKASL